MIRKCFAILLVCFQVSGPAFASVLTVEDVSVIGAAADDYYTGSKTKLKVLDGNKIGKTLVTSAEVSSTAALSGLVAGAAGIAGIAYYERTGQDPVYAAANAVASAADAIFQPAYQAFKANFVSPESYPASAAQYVGTEGSVGATIGDILNLVKSAVDDTYLNLASAIASNTSTTTVPSGSLGTGEIIQIGDTNYLITGGGTASGLAKTTISSATPYTATSSGKIFVIGADLYEYRGETYNGIAAIGVVYLYRCSVTTAPATLYPGVSINYPGLKDALSSPSPAVADELQTAIQNLPSDQKITSNDSAPSSVPAQSPSPLTNGQIQNFFTENTTNVYNEYLTSVQNGGDAVTGQVAAETAKAQEEEANKETEDTYSPINDNPFTSAYNPGEFDIPARMTTFLSNVKSSGLFSFSSAFFDSLPGGGTSTYTIEAGQYGTHTVNLNDTLSPGLAVLKAILLACFGFLSIRAVIMKR
nr:hypothetical protein [uncultured Desulfobulbus sp.]